MNSSYLWFNSASRNLGNDGLFSCQLNKQTQQCIPPTTTTPVLGTLFNNTNSPEFGIDTNTLLDSLDPSTAKNIFYIKNDVCDIHIIRAALMTTDYNSPSASSELLLLQPETFMTFKHNFYVSTNMEDSCFFNNSTTLAYKDLGITGFAFEPSMNPDDYDDNDNNERTAPSLYVSWKANTLNCSTPYNHSSYDDYYDKFRYTIGVSKILTNVPGCVVGDSSSNDTIPSWGNDFDDTMWRRCTQVMATFYNGCHITDSKKTSGGGFGCSDLRCVDGGDMILDYYDENNTTSHVSVDPFRNGFSVGKTSRGDDLFFLSVLVSNYGVIIDDDIEGGPFIDYEKIDDTRNEIWVAGIGGTPDDVVTIGDPIGIDETDIVWMDNYNAYDAGTIRLRPNLNTLATEAVCWSTMLGIYCRGLSFGDSGSANKGDEMTIETTPLEMALTAQDMADICGLDYLPRYVTGMAVDWSTGDGAGAGGSDVFDTIYFGCAYNYDLPGNFASVDAAGHVRSMLEGEKGDNGGYWPGSVLFGPFGGVVPDVLDESSGYVACPFISNHSPLSSLVLSALIMISFFHHSL